MRIALTGGGTGGHFYPLIAVTQAIEDLCAEKTLIEPEIYYFGPKAFDGTAILEHDIIHISSPAGKGGEGPIAKIAGFFGALIGTIRATLQLFRVYPDVVFSTGGYAAFPTLMAARLLMIPVVIYDADATPGKVSRWSAKFAKWIAVAHPDAGAQFPAKLRPKIARVGHPIRKEIMGFAREGGHEFLKLDPSVPTIFVIGGSQGARKINETLLDALPDLVTRYNIVHQAGVANLEEVNGIASVSLKGSPYYDRYRIFGLLNTLAIRMTAGISSIVVSRAGSGSIFEIASWNIPAILIPIPPDVSHDQTENAYSYARAGGAVVIEQENLSSHVLAAEIDRLMNDATKREGMIEAAKRFARPDAARKIASVLLEEAISHEPV